MTTQQQSGGIMSWLSTGVDVKAVCVGLFTVVGLFWNASIKWNDIETHLKSIDDFQHSQAAAVDDKLKDMQSDLLRRMQDNRDYGIRERQVLSDKVVNLEKFRDDEQRRASDQDTTIAKVSEQFSAISASVSDLKAMLQNVFMRMQQPSATIYAPQTPAGTVIMPQQPTGR